ncbi:MAG: DMT family protein [Bacteroidia bacterium]
MKALQAILLLVLSNSFMTLAWYGHLRFKQYSWGASLGLVAVILISWAIALPEYSFQVPANRIGYRGNGGPFDLFQLKILQEVITLVVFTLFALFVFRTEQLRLNHLYAFLCILGAVYFAFRQ